MMRDEAKGLSDVAEKTYSVKGMTCEHCVHAVTTEVGKVDGVRQVEIDLASGQVRIDGEGFADDQIREAVDEAGYELA